MQRQKRPFYIIGHNPNTITEAKEFLDNGVNALEPDVVHAEGRFYVSHHHLPSYAGIPTVEEYLQELKALLLEKQYNLALIIWDMKDTDINLDHFMSLVKENFSGNNCDRVAMLMTHADDHDFVNSYKGSFENVGIGVDESDVPPLQLQEIFRDGGHQNFCYADGITTFLTKPGVYNNITAAQHCRNQYEPGSFKLIYTWVLSHEASMRRYLDTYIDGIMVDAGSVLILKELVTTTPYNEIYQLAENGYNPFSAAPLPKYFLSVETSDELLSGTDARILFTLNGASSLSLSSLPFNGNTAGALESGTTTNLTLEGLDLGEIESLRIEALTEGLGSAWLPASITLTSKLLEEPITFVFNNADQKDWITKKGGSVVKFVDH